MSTENTNLSELANQKANGKKNFFELIRFVIVGGMSTVVDLVVTTVLVFTTALNANFITTIAFLTAFLVSFFGHRYFTFKRKGSILSFFALAVSTLILRNIFVWFMLHILNLSNYPALIIAMVLVTGITYFVAKFKVFKGN